MSEEGVKKQHKNILYEVLVRFQGSDNSAQPHGAVFSERWLVFSAFV